MKLSTPCEPWDGPMMANGYGRLEVYDRKGNPILAHRYTWERAHGQVIPPGLVVRHRCDNPPCCAEDHLIIGTHKDNSRDMVERGRDNKHQARKTHCPQGHEYTKENTYRPKRGDRQCRECGRVAARERYRAKVGLDPARYRNSKYQLTPGS